MPIEGTGICSGVSAVEFEGKIYAFFMTEKLPNQLALSHLVLKNGLDNQLIVEKQEDFPLGGLTRHRPAVTVFNGHLFCFHTVTDRTVHYHVFSGAEWSHGGVVPGVLTDRAPSVASIKDKLYLAVQGTYYGEFYHKIFENYEWKGTLKNIGIRTNGSPFLCAVGDSLVAAMAGPDNALTLFELSSEQWQPLYKSPHYKIMGSPALYASNNFLMCASLSSPDQHFNTEALRHTPSNPNQKVLSTHLDKTIGKYLSEPFIINYRDRLYLIGQRPCNDIGISLYAPHESPAETTLDTPPH